jgi:hypothetical protein
MGDGLKRARAAAKASRPPSPLTKAAKAIRADIKAAVSDGTLPALPDGAVIRVRSRRASLMTAIDIEIENVPRSWLIEAGTPNRRSGASRLLELALLAIGERYYRADGRGSFLDVQFHLKAGA